VNVQRSRTAVVIPVFNRASLGRQALDAVLAQSRPPDHLVVVDDGSTDGTSTAIENWRDEFKPAFRVTIETLERNSGACTARNRGVELADDCDLIAYLDSDDIWPRSYLEQMVGQIEKDADLVAVSRDYWLEFNRDMGRRECDLSGIARDAPLQIFKNNTAIPSATIVRRSAHQAIGGWDPQVFCSNDLDYFLRMSLHGPWGWNDGEPIELRWHMNQQGSTDLEHLSAQIRRPAGRVLRLEVRERFLFECGGQKRIPQAVWKKKLAAEWYMLGVQLADRGRHDEAKWCFGRVLQLRWYGLRAWYQFLIKHLRVSPLRPQKVD